MPATVYPNTKNSASYSQDLSAEEKHPLQLSAQDRIDITQQFIRQISISCLSSRAYRIMCAIFSQTLDFNKLEDDMNGKRLQQLTGIFPHHANATVRELEAMKAIITRKGRYGKYMAINFDFAQWGKGDCDKYPNNDPYFLLMDEAEQDDEEQQQSDIPPEQTSADKPQTQQHTEHQETVDLAYTNELLQHLVQAIEDLTTRMERLEEAQQQRLLDDEKVTSTAGTTTDSSTESTTNEDEQSPETHTESHTETNATKKVASPNVALCFPPQLSQAQCDSAATLLATADDKAQVLLDMLTKRLRNTDNPVRNPIAYLNNLLKRSKHNKLDQPSTAIMNINHVNTTPAQVPQPNPANNDLAEQQAEYQEAAADCFYMERNIKLMAENDNLSFEDCLNKRALKPWWKSVTTRLATAKEALAAIQPIEAVAA